MRLTWIAVFLFIAAPAIAKDLYASPDLEQWYASLMQPDADVSCCGAADAYYADKTEECPVNNDVCGLVAIITDARPDSRTLPSGKIISRMHVPVGTKIIIPKSKIRRVAVPNPTDHTIVFYSAANSWVYCYEPRALF